MLPKVVSIRSVLKFIVIDHDISKGPRRVMEQFETVPYFEFWYGIQGTSMALTESRIRAKTMSLMPAIYSFRYDITR